MGMFQLKIDKYLDFGYNMCMKIIPLIAFAFLSIASSLYASPITSDTHQDLLEAIREVESNNNPDAVGDNGNAIGVYQIWEIYWKDAVEFDPSIGGEYKDCFNPEYAEKIVLAYWNRYGTIRRLGRTPTNEDLARIHNGGPNGYKKTATDKYWKKVKKKLNE